MYWAAGPTKITTSVAAVLPEFLELIQGTYTVTSYEYPGGTNIWPTAQAACSQDDVFTFLKTGDVLRAEGASACPTPDAFQSPVSAAGAVWSTWTLLDGSTINIRDLDPTFDFGANPDAGFSISGGTVTIDYGGGYIATLTRN
jgi:hypothetical protein